MVEHAFGTESLRPEAVEIVPTSVVDELVARNEAELAVLRSELEGALREAEEVEGRLASDPVANQYSDALEAEVVEYISKIASYIARDELSGAVPDRRVEDFSGRDRWLPTNGSGTLGADPVGPRTSSAEAETRTQARPETSLTLAQAQLVAEFGTPVDVVGSPGPYQAASGPLAWGTHQSDTVVLPLVAPPPPAGDALDLDRTRTVVVQRAKHVMGAPQESALTSDRPAAAPDDLAEASRTLETSSGPAVEAAETTDVVDSQTVDPNGSWLAKVPSRLLIQLGLIIVIVGLLVLKLG